MKTEEKSVNNKKLIPFWVIERALEGDIQAINKILKHYEGYIAKLSVRKAQELAKNAKPGSLTSKANLVNKYNSGVKTEEVIPEKQDNKKKK